MPGQHRDHDMSIELHAALLATTVLAKGPGRATASPAAGCGTFQAAQRFDSLKRKLTRSRR